MSFTRIDVRKSVHANFQDDARFITEAELDEMIDNAKRRLDRDRPYNHVFDIAGDGTNDYDLTSAFIKGFSNIETVEYPAGENIPIYKDRNDDWIIYEDPTKNAGEKMRLRFILESPATGNIIRVKLTAPWTLDLDDATASTMDQNAFIALVLKTMVYAARALAAKFGQTMDPTIEADVTDRSGLTSNYLFLAERYNTEYKSLTGVDAPVKAASAIEEFDIKYQWGEDMFWHHSRHR